MKKTKIPEIDFIEEPSEDVETDSSEKLENILIKLTSILEVMKTDVADNNLLKALLGFAEFSKIYQEVRKNTLNSKRYSIEMAKIEAINDELLKFASQVV